jgi:hypothetical protein
MRKYITLILTVATIILFWDYISELPVFQPTF